MDNGTIALYGVVLACIGQIILTIAVVFLLVEVNKLVLIIGSMLLGRLPITHVSIGATYKSEAVDADNA